MILFITIYTCISICIYIFLIMNDVHLLDCIDISDEYLLCCMLTLCTGRPGLCLVLNCTV